MPSGLLRLAAVLLAALAGKDLPGQILALELRPFPGLPRASRLTSMGETPDGRLWFSFADSLWCHDGIRLHEVPIAPNADGRSPAMLRALAASAGGDLLVGGHSGVWRIGPGSDSALFVAATAGLSVHALAAEPDGTVWIRTATGLHLLTTDDICVPLATPDGSPGLKEIVCTQNSIWAWSSRWVWQLQRAGREVTWRAVPLPASELRTAAPRGDDLVVVGDGDVYQIGAGRSIRRLGSDPALATVSRAACTEDACWFADGQHLLCLDRDDPWVREVRMFDAGEMFAPDYVAMLATDRQGLLWIATNRCVYRATPLPGVRHWIAAGLCDHDHVSALTEIDGRIHLGTRSGALLRQRTDDPHSWESVDVPWLEPGLRGPGSIVALQPAPGGGELLVDTRRRGVWLLRDATWTHLVPTTDELRFLAVAPDGSLIGGGKDRLWRRHPATALDADRREAGLPPRSRPAALAFDECGDGWLATWLGGLFELDRATLATRSLEADWAGESVSDLACTRHGLIWAAGNSGLWRVDTRSGTRDLLLPTPRGNALLALCSTSGGSVWLVQQNRLMHVDGATHRVRVLPAGQGSHPLGTSRCRSLRRADDSVWFGAETGYTTIAPDSTPQLGPRVRVAGTTVLAAGVPVPDRGEANRFAVEAGAGALQVRCRVVDRSNDLPASYRIVLRSREDDRTAHGDDGRIDDVPPGDYELLAVVTQPNGDTFTAPLGTLEVQQRQALWPWLALAGALAGGLSTIALLRHLRGRFGSARRLSIQQVLGSVRERQEETLDIAFVGAAVAEQCMVAGNAGHASLWLHDPRHGTRVCVARFGRDSEDAEQRVRACCETGARAGEFTWLRDDRGACDLTMCLGDESSLQLEILLQRVPPPDAAIVRELEGHAAPVLAAMHRQAWQRRLEQDFVQQRLSLEADVHDLRSPLTTLRMNASFLAARLAEVREGELRSSAQDLVEAADDVQRAIDEMLQLLDRRNELQPVPADPLLLLVARARALSPLAASKRIEIDLPTVTAIDGVRLDPVWFGRVVENVVGNAIKYAPPGSTIRIRHETIEGWFVVHVDDEGPGFSELDRKNAFLPGFTGAARPTGGEAQSGMGLWISRHAMRGMHGRLWIAEREGCGARLAFALPRGPAAGRDAGPAGGTGHSG